MMMMMLLLLLLISERLNGHSFVRFSRSSSKLVMRVVVQEQTPTPPYQLAWIAAALALAAVSSCFPCLSQLEEEEEEFRRQQQQQQQTEMYSNNNRQGRQGEEK